MRNRSWYFGLLLAGAVLIAATVFAWQRGETATKSSTAPVDDSVISLLVRLGVNDTEPRKWTGTVTVTNGEVSNIRNWHPRPGDKIIGASGWSFATRRGRNYRRRAWEEELPTAPVPYLLIPGVVVDVKTQPGTVVNFQTKNGDFQVDPKSLEAGKAQSFLNGAVVVDRVPTAYRLSTEGYQNDFATMAGGNGEVWAAWVAYRHNASEVLARRFDGKAWGPIQKVTEHPGDIFLVKMGRARNGVWAVWSAQVNKNWDLYGRRFDGNSWSATARLTDEPQPDIYHNLATDSSGRLWLVWQGFRNGSSDIFARYHDGSAWSSAERVSASPANDWEPAVAANGAGTVYVAWDTYDKGNYDVVMRQFANGKWAEMIGVAGTPKYEAHVSLACDKQDQLWAAWNESGLQWGKDTGFLLKKEGTRLYQWRTVAVAVHTGGAWRQPATELEESLPKEIRGYNDLPVLHADDDGRVWLFFRHRTLRIRDVPSDAPAHRAAWEIFATTYQGDRWMTPIQLPFSQGRTDMHSGLANDGRGNTYVAWPTDNRDFEGFLFERAEVYAARFPIPPGRSVAPKLTAKAIPKLTTFPAHPKETEDLERIRGYTIQSEGRTYHIYRGDTHRHTEFSMDGNNDGTLQQTYRYALDAASLDFLGVSDHNSSGGPDVEYVNWLLQQMADVFRLPRTFTPLYGYERSLSYPNGHRNVMFARRGRPTLPIPAAERKGGVGAKSLYEYLKRYGGIAISHTSATGMGTDWRDNDPEVEPLVEIYQGDRVSAEYEGAPKAAHRGNPSSAPGGFRPAGYVWNAWAKGYKLGVQVSSDHLSTHISYACTLATDFTAEGLLDAMRKRHSYGATDNIILDYRLQTGDREYLQGDIVKVNRQIDIVKNNTFVHNRQPLQQEVSFSFVDSQPGSGENYYYVRVIQVDDQIAWSSPIWVMRE
jgi:hypothetical protein